MYPATAFKYLERALQEGLGRRKFGSAEMTLVIEFFGDECVFCGSEAWNRWDHLVSAIAGGESVLGNMVPACQSCDDSKGSRAFDSWMMARASAKPDALWAADTAARIDRLRAYQRQFKYEATKAESRLSPERRAQFDELVRRTKELQREIEAFLRTPRDGGRVRDVTNEGAVARGGPSLSEAAILEIAAVRLERDGYLDYADFEELRPVGQTGNRYLFAVKLCLLDNGYRVHERRHRAEWGNCGYPGDNTHFHAA